MKTLTTKQAVLSLCALLLCATQLWAQCIPTIKIDGNEIIVDDANIAGLKFPSWLATGQTLAKGQAVYSIAVIEFTVNGTALDYSRNISVTTVQTVPAGKVWKVEAAHKEANLVPPVPIDYTTPGTYTYTPTCTGLYTIRAWGAGGGGGAYYSGGGSGAYVSGGYQLVAGTAYTVTVGAGGISQFGYSGIAGANGGDSKVSLVGINAGGGLGGSSSGCIPGNTGGIAVSGSVVSSPNAINGGNVRYNPTYGACADGGNCPNGGVGGSAIAGVASGGTFPGGGAGCNTTSGANGANGKVSIAFGNNSSKPCTAMYLNFAPSGSGPNDPTGVSNLFCPIGFTDGGVGQSSSGYYIRTCYKCD